MTPGEMAARFEAIVDALRPFAWAGELMAARPTTVKCVPDLQPGDPDRCEVVTVVGDDTWRILELRHFRRAREALIALQGRT